MELEARPKNFGLFRNRLIKLGHVEHKCDVYWIKSCTVRDVEAFKADVVQCC